VPIIMEETKLEIPLLQSGEKVIGAAFLTQDGEVIFTSHPDAIEVVLVQPQPGCSGPWAVRRRPPKRSTLGPTKMAASA